MANARMAVGGAGSLRPARELATGGALAIARNAQSQATENRALINLADIRLRRRNSGSARPRATRDRDGWRRQPDRDQQGHGIRIVRTNQWRASASPTESWPSTALGATARSHHARRYELSGTSGRPSRRLPCCTRRKLNDEIALAARQKALLEIEENTSRTSASAKSALLNRKTN
jgi:hypothetical protein